MTRRHVQLGRRHVGAAYHDGHLLAGRRPVRACQQRGDADHGGGFGRDAQRLPQRLLRGADGVVGNEDDVIDVSLGDRDHQLADPPGGQGIRRDAAGRGVDRLALGAGIGECRRAVGLNADDPDAASEVGRRPGDQATATDRDQHGADLIGLRG
jgi:hypothetical protein